MYRFLSDPKPSMQVVTRPCPTHPKDLCATPEGRDDSLLAQRAAFLRPDSAVVIVQLTDENDCSIRDSDQYYYAARDDITLPHSSGACLVNPNDPCCYSCATLAPSGCQPDPACSTRADPKGDQFNLRCFEQKRRFGLSFLYPVRRYVNALTHTHLCTSRVDVEPRVACPDGDGDGKPDIVPNPLFQDLSGGGALVRSPSMVYLVGIVGVPWQDVATSSSATSLRYQSPAELAKSGTWDVIIGTRVPGNGAPPVLPTDQLMVESVYPRSGDDGESPPVPLAPPSAASMANPVNGHEWSNDPGLDDLQFACIFPLVTPRDCSVGASPQSPASPSCDCKPAAADARSPLCQDPTSGAYGTHQYYARAYPGLRELEVLKGVGSNGVVASICTRNLTDTSGSDYGYRPAIDAFIAQLNGSLH